MEQGMGTSAAGGTVSPSRAGVWRGWKGLCRAGAAVARGESLLGWSCGNGGAGSGAEEVPDEQGRGCIVSRSLQDSGRGAWLGSGYGAGQAGPRRELLLCLPPVLGAQGSLLP